MKNDKSEFFNNLFYVIIKKWLFIVKKKLTVSYPDFPSLYSGFIQIRKNSELKNLQELFTTIGILAKKVHNEYNRLVEMGRYILGDFVVIFPECIFFVAKRKFTIYQERIDSFIPNRIGNYCKF